MNILTFDLEEWFHILDNDSTEAETQWGNYERRFVENVTRITDLLDAVDQKATFFCMGWIAREYPAIIQRLAEAGHEIASHSDRHQLAYHQGRRQFEEDLKRSVDCLEDLIGKKVTAYRAPGFSLTAKNQWVFEALVGHGIKIDCSIFSPVRAHGGFSATRIVRPTMIEAGDIRIKEFPINAFHLLSKDIVFSGGGYFRLWPYFFIRYAMSKSDYVMTYFHPRDFDPGQPIIRELSLVRKFKSYCGLSGAFQKLKKILREFRFVNLETADKLIDWGSCAKMILQGRGT